MKFDLRDWIFEFIAVLIPGGIVFSFSVLFLVNPQDFIFEISNIKQIENVIFPFKDSLANYLILFAVSFMAGHLVQQVSKHFVTFYSLILRKEKINVIDKVFSLPPVREYILSSESGISIAETKFSNADYFMMIYPEIAPQTKRDTFITVSDFCGSMIVVTNLLMILSLVSAIVMLMNGQPFPYLLIIAIESLGFVFSFLWFKRHLYFSNLAHLVVINHFLGKFGAYLRDKLDQNGEN